MLRITKSACPTKSHYVPTDHYPAEYATRTAAAGHLKSTTSFTGPAFLYNTELIILENDTF